VAASEASDAGNKLIPHLFDALMLLLHTDAPAAFLFCEVKVGQDSVAARIEQKIGGPRASYQE
jgi:hypothetical protein